MKSAYNKTLHCYKKSILVHVLRCHLILMVFAQPTIILRAFKSLKDYDERQFSVDILICSVQPTVSTTRKTHSFDRLSGTVCAKF